MSPFLRQESEDSSRDKDEPKSTKAKANNKAVKACRQRKEREARKREQKTKILKEKIPSLRENVRIRLEIIDSLLNLLSQCHSNPETINKFMEYFDKIKKEHLKRSSLNDNTAS